MPHEEGLIITPVDENKTPPIKAIHIDVSRYFDTGQKDLTSTGTVYSIVKLRGGESVIIKAKQGNSGQIYLGKKDVTTTTGFELSPGDAVIVNYSPDKVSEEFIELFATPASAGDDVTFMMVP